VTLCNFPLGVAEFFLGGADMFGKGYASSLVFIAGDLG
jgi:hypothetical protein